MEKTEKAVAKPAEKKPAAKKTEATPLYQGYLTAFGKEGKAVAKTSEKIELIRATNLTLPEFFSLLWSEKYRVPGAWPLNSSGAPLSPTSSKTRAAMPEINRLVSALAMRKQRKTEPPKPTEPTATEPPVPDGSDGSDGSGSGEGTGANIEAYNFDACVGQLQALLVKSFETDAAVYNAAKCLIKLLIDKN